MGVTWAVFAAMMVMLAVSLLEGRIKRMDRDLRRLERKVDLLMAHLGVREAEPEAIAEVDALLRQGKKGKAIKRYIELTGAGLKEAKNVVDQRPG